MTCQSICDRNEHKTEAPPRMGHTFNQCWCANKRKVLAGDPGCDGGLEPSRGFMPLPCVDRGFADSHYFSQESCQRDWEPVACSVMKTVSVPSPEVNTRWCCHPLIARLACSFTLFLLLRLFKTSPLRILCWWSLPRSVWDTEKDKIKCLSGSLAQTSRVKPMLHESCKQRCHDVYLKDSSELSSRGENSPGDNDHRSYLLWWVSIGHDAYHPLPRWAGLMPRCPAKSSLVQAENARWQTQYKLSKN